MKKLIILSIFTLLVGGLAVADHGDMEQPPKDTLEVSDTNLDIVEDRGWLDWFFSITNLDGDSPATIGDELEFESSVRFNPDSSFCNENPDWEDSYGFWVYSDSGFDTSISGETGDYWWDRQGDESNNQDVSYLMDCSGDWKDVTVTFEPDNVVDDATFELWYGGIINDGLTATCPYSGLLSCPSSDSNDQWGDTQDTFSIAPDYDDPEVSMIMPPTGDIGESISMSAEIDYQGEIDIKEWVITQGPTINDNAELIGTGDSISHTFTEEGTYEILFVAEDLDTRQSDSATKFIGISDETEDVWTSLDVDSTSVEEGTGVNIEADAGGGEDSLSYQFYIDGSPITEQQSSSSTTYVFENSGSYNVEVVVTDGVGEATDSTTVEVVPEGDDTNGNGDGNGDDETTDGAHLDMPVGLSEGQTFVIDLQTDEPVESASWTLSGGDLDQPLQFQGTEVVIQGLPDGDYIANVDISYTDGSTDSVTEQFQVGDGQGDELNPAVVIGGVMLFFMMAIGVVAATFS